MSMEVNMKLNSNPKRKAVFLDRDGVINKLIMRNGLAQAPYVIEEFELYPGVTEAINQLKENQFLTVIVTNQPDVARGWVSIDSVTMINNRILELLPIDEIRICFHINEDNCHCRKPKPGMLTDAAQKWNIDLRQSFMFGDRYGDISAGKRAGCKTFLVGHGDKQGGHPDPDYKVSSLIEGVQHILIKQL